MLPLLIAGLAAAAVLLIAVGISMSGGSGGVAERLQRYARSGGDTSAEGDEVKDSAVMAGLSSVIERQGATERLATEIARADLKLRPAEFVALWIASPFVFVAASFILGIVFSALQHPITLAVMFVIGIFFPRFYLRRRQAKRVKLFGDQLPDTITLLANSLRAGSSFLQGLELRHPRGPAADLARSSSAWYAR